MASCLTISGLVVLALAFIACAVSLVAPYWVVKPKEVAGGVAGTVVIDNLVNVKEYWGLFANCNKEHVCTWFFENEFQWEQNREGKICHKIIKSLKVFELCVLTESWCG